MLGSATFATVLSSVLTNSARHAVTSTKRRTSRSSLRVPPVGAVREAGEAVSVTGAGNPERRPVDTGQLGRHGGEGIPDGVDEGECGLSGELDRYPGRRAAGGVGKVDVEGVLGLRVHRVVVIHGGGGEAKPACGALAAAGDRALLGGVGAHRASSGCPVTSTAHVRRLLRCRPKKSWIRSQPST